MILPGLKMLVWQNNRITTYACVAQLGSDPSAACGRCSEVSEWQRSNFQAKSESRAENLGTATGRAVHGKTIE